MPRKKAPPKAEQAFELIRGMNSWELKLLLERLSEELGLEIPPILVASAQQSTNGSEQLPPGEGQGLLNVAITSYGDGGYGGKITVIQAIRSLCPTLGLKEAKDLVETVPSYHGDPPGPPAVILEEVSLEEAEAAKKKLEEAGATVDLYPV